MVMILVGSEQGTAMTFLAPVASTFGLCSSTSMVSVSSETSFCLVKGVSFLGGRCCRDPKRWHCKYSVTTTAEFIADHANAPSLDPHGNFGGNSANDAGIELKPALKPVPKHLGPKNDLLPWNPSRAGLDSNGN